MSSNKQQTFNRSDIELALIKEFPSLSKSQISLAIDSILESIVDAVALDDKVVVKDEVDKAFQFAENSPFPKKEDVFKYIYAGV